MRLSAILIALLLSAPTGRAFECATLPSPAPANSGESSLVTDSGGTTYLTYAGPGLATGERALWLATLAPGASGWSAPRAIVSTPRLMENWADFATLAVGTDGQLWVQWYQTRAGEDAHGYDGWFARSRDGGATWSPPAPLGHEFVSLAALSGGRVMAVWLESTAPRGAATRHAHAAPAAPGTSAPTMRLKARLLAPDGATVQDWVVDPDTCTCCQTTLAHLGGDRLVLAYRGHNAEEVRDTRLAFFHQTIWSPHRSLHDDGWKIPACPVNGPSADARGESLAVAWFTAAHGLARVQAKLSRDGGITFSPPIAIDLGRPIGRLDLAMLADGSALVSWLEARADNATAGLYVRRLFPDGSLSAPQLISAMRAVRASGFARFAARRDGDGLSAVISWTDVTPQDATNLNSAAATQVRTALISATNLPPAADQAAAPRPRAVVRGGDLALLEVCEPAAGDHPSSP